VRRPDPPQPLLVVSRIGFALAISVTIWLSLAPLSGLHSAASIPDVLSHFIGYAGLGALAIASGLRPLTAFFLLVAFGALLEIVQGASGHRFFEFKDIAVNALGLIAGIALVVFLRRTIHGLRM
jgi:VanZ family protein